MMRGSLIFLVLLAACGYQISNPKVAREVSVPIFENTTERRINEFELTRAVIKELTNNGVKVNKDATLELRGKITYIDEPVAVSGALDVVLVGSFSIKIKATLIDKNTGKIVFDEELASSASFTSVRGKTRDNALQESFDSLAKNIAAKLEVNW